MPYKKFFEEGSEDQNLPALTSFLTDSTVKILWKHAETLMFKQKDKGIYGKTIFYVFYQDIQDELHQELNNFKNKLEIAKQVSTDERYYTLKNLKQRELFLLSEYFLSKTEAQDVIELLKPEIAKIISDSEKDKNEPIPIKKQNTNKPKLKAGEVIEDNFQIEAGEVVENRLQIEPKPDIDAEMENSKEPSEEEIDKEMREIEKELG